jgi:hypothetical protein
MRIIIRNTTLALGLLTCFAILYNFSTTLQPSFEKLKKSWNKQSTEKNVSDESTVNIRQCSTQQEAPAKELVKTDIKKGNKNPLESNIIAHLWSVSANETTDNSNESEKVKRNPIALSSLFHAIFRQARN